MFMSGANGQTVSCKGNTSVTVGSSVRNNTPYKAIFKIEGSVVSLIQGDALLDAKTYHLDESISLPNRPGYTSDKGNLFFYTDSGDFKILRMRPLRHAPGMEVVESNGSCEKFKKSNVFG